MDQILNTLQPFFGPGLILILIILFLQLNSLLFSKLKTIHTTGAMKKRTISFLIVLIGTLVFILSLPIDKGIKGQILSFLGIIISAGIALSSTTILGNLIAGIMNNSMNRFRNGDLIKVSDLQGRVTKKSAFHTEIQLEDSNFMTIPNLFIATQPVKLTRKTNTVISTTVSLGYDVPRTKIEEALKEAALSAGLTDPYVYITELGDFSVVYKIHGFLKDSTKFFSANSLLNAKVMDVLHEKEIEIVSPSFMNQRKVDQEQFIPRTIVHEPRETKEESPEDLIFSEANEAAKIENKKEYLTKIENKIGTLKEQIKELKYEGEIEKLKSTIERLEESKKKLEKSIQEQNKEKGK